MLADLNHLHPTLSENEATTAAPIGLPDLARWQAGSLEGGWVTVTATDWLSALGAALYRMGLSDGLQRMGCEVLPNGTVIANDITQRRPFSTQ